MLSRNSKFLGKSVPHTDFDGQCVYHGENGTKEKEVLFVGILWYISQFLPSNKYPNVAVIYKNTHLFFAHVTKGLQLCLC